MYISADVATSTILLLICGPYADCISSIVSLTSLGSLARMVTVQSHVPSSKDIRYTLGIENMNCSIFCSSSGARPVNCKYIL